MRHRIVLSLAIALPASIGLFFAACGGDTTTTGDGGPDATSDTTTNPDTGTGTDTGTGSDTGTDAGSDAAADGCAALGSTAACTGCCNTTYADAAAELAATVFDCACGVDGGGGACSSQCASTLCQGSQPSGQCNSCLNQGGTGSCNAKANAACMDGGCSAVLNCIATCP